MSNFTRYEPTEDVALITMDDGKANAFGFDMMEALSNDFTRAASEAKAVVLTGRPGVMCAGFDLKLMKTEPARVGELVGRGAKLLSQILVHPQPVVIAASGHAMAAGGLLMLTGDIRIGARGDFRIGLNETAIGMVMPDFGIYLAHHCLGESNLTEAVLNARLYSPDEAVSVGYLDSVCEAGKLVETAIARAEELTQLDMRAYAGTKRKLRQPIADRIDESLARDNLNIMDQG